MEIEYHDLPITGIFPETTTGNFVLNSYRVKRASMDRSIPNYGIVPLIDRGRFELIFEDGVPIEVKAHLVIHYGFGMPRRVLTAQILSRDVKMINDILRGLIAEKRLKRKDSGWAWIQVPG